MPPAEFGPAIPGSKRPQTHALDRTATGIGRKANVYEAVFLIVLDIVDHRLGVAADLGADYTYLSEVGEDEQETVKAVHSLLGGPPDVTIDCSGAEANIRLAILVRRNLLGASGNL
jgi:threonine dehydrogenase-like Zn-dependent dehydrogenase